MMNRNNQSTKPNEGASAGFTLIEVIIALAILGVGLLGMAAMQSYANSKDNEARYYTDANILATHLIEGLMSLEFNDPDLSGNTAAPGSSHTRVSTVNGNRANVEGSGYPYDQYPYRYTVLNDQATPTYKIIRLQVDFSARSGQKSGRVNLTQLKPRAHEVK